MCLRSKIEFCENCYFSYMLCLLECDSMLVGGWPPNFSWKPTVSIVRSDLLVDFSLTEKVIQLIKKS